MLIYFLAILWMYFITYFYYSLNSKALWASLCVQASPQLWVSKLDFYCGLWIKMKAIFFISCLCVCVRANTQTNKNMDWLLPWTLPPAPLEVSRSSFIHLNEAGFRLEFSAWAVRKNYLQVHRSDLWRMFPLAKRGSRSLQHPKQSAAPMWLAEARSSHLKIIHPLWLQYHSVISGQLNWVETSTGDSPPALAKGAKSQELCMRSTAHVSVAPCKDTVPLLLKRPPTTSLLMRCNTHH